MTTTTAHSRGSVTHTATRIGRVNLGYLGWYWLVVTPFFVAFSFWLARVNGGLDAAVILYSRQGAIWFPFAQAIATVAVYLRVHVAAGMTRRAFARATLLVGVGTGVAYAAVLTALAAVERELHGHAAALVQHRGDDAAVQHAGLGVADEDGAIGQAGPGLGRRKAVELEPADMAVI